eukprot:GHUV01025288.1.p1 GENE.GHUV01025288.1~~GHUV01025288.1.p1  ORF type:complete len:102 (+),score=15.26 GHUV01025288.1:267-572(+)
MEWPRPRPGRDPENVVAAAAADATAVVAEEVWGMIVQLGGPANVQRGVLCRQHCIDVCSGAVMLWLELPMHWQSQLITVVVGTVHRRKGGPHSLLLNKLRC